MGDGGKVKAIDFVLDNVRRLVSLSSPIPGRWSEVILDIPDIPAGMLPTGLPGCGDVRITVGISAGPGGDAVIGRWWLLRGTKLRGGVDVEGVGEEALRDFLGKD